MYIIYHYDRKKLKINFNNHIIILKIFLRNIPMKVKLYFPISINIDCSIITPNERKLIANKVPIEFENESIAGVQWTSYFIFRDFVSRIREKKGKLSGGPIKPIYQKSMLCARVRSSFPSFSSPSSIALSRKEAND